MRIIFGLCAFILLAGGALAWRSTQTPERFGAFTGAPAEPLANVVAQPAAYLGRAVLLEGDVRRQCKVTGCFFSFVAGEKSLRVELEAVAPRAPQREGRRARVEGQVVRSAAGFEVIANAVEFL